MDPLQLASLVINGLQLLFGLIGLLAGANDDKPIPPKPPAMEAPLEVEGRVGQEWD